MGFTPSLLIQWFGGPAIPLPSRAHGAGGFSGIAGTLGREKGGRPPGSMLVPPGRESACARPSRAEQPCDNTTGRAIRVRPSPYFAIKIQLFALSRKPVIHRLNCCYESKDYECWNLMKREKLKRRTVENPRETRWKKATVNNHCYLRC